MGTIVPCQKKEFSDDECEGEGLGSQNASKSVKNRKKIKKNESKSANMFRNEVSGIQILKHTLVSQGLETHLPYDNETDFQQFDQEPSGAECSYSEQNKCQTERIETQEFSDDESECMSSLESEMKIQSEMTINQKNNKKTNNKSNNAKKLKIEAISKTKEIQGLNDPNISQTLSPKIVLDIETIVQELDHEPSRAECSHSEQNKCQTESNATEVENTLVFNDKRLKKKNKRQNKNQRKGNGFESNRLNYYLRDESPNLKAIPGVCGLQNLGNTCYMNSTIQCLSNIQLFTDFAKEFAKRRQNNNHLIDIYCRLIDNMWSGKRNSISPNQFKASVDKHLKNFCGYGQKDCAELLTSALSHFHEELLHIELKQTNQYMDYNNYEDFLQNNNTFIAQNFYSFQRIRMTCDCGQVLMESFDPMLVLNLPYTKRSNSMSTSTNVILIRKTGKLFKFELKFADKLIEVKHLKNSLIRELKNNNYIELSEDDLIVTQMTNAMIVKFFPNECFLDLGDLKNQVYVYEKDSKLEQVFIHLSTESDYFGIPMLLNVREYNLETIREEFCAKMQSNLNQNFTGEESDALQTISFVEGNGMSFISGIKNLRTETLCDSIRSKYCNPLKSYVFYNIIRTKRQDFDSYIKLEESLDNYISVRKMNSSDPLYCSRCMIDVCPNEQTSLVFAPNVLILQLKTNPNQQISYHEIQYQFPLVLDFKRFVLNSEQNIDLLYDLIAVSNYSGTAYSGHYTACARNYLNGKWYAFNDSYVNEISKTELISSRAYLLFYVRRQKISNII